LAKVDALVGELVDSLKKAQVLDVINLIVTGLHGFAEVQTHPLLLFTCFTNYNLRVRAILFNFLLLTRVLIHK
jgi:hypothetical protein